MIGFVNFVSKKRVFIKDCTFVTFPELQSTLQRHWKKHGIMLNAHPHRKSLYSLLRLTNLCVHQWQRSKELQTSLCHFWRDVDQFTFTYKMHQHLKWLRSAKLTNYIMNIVFVQTNFARSIWRVQSNSEGSLHACYESIGVRFPV